MRLFARPTGRMEDDLRRPLRDVLAVMQQRIMEESSYFGIKTLKSPIDAWVYQELIHQQRPDVIVEIGNYHGGSALQLAHLCDALGHGRVLGCDLSHADVPDLVRQHPRITLLEGDACALYEQIRDLIGDDRNVMVIEDSAHSYDNTLAVLRTYAPLIPVGGWFIVEDSICHHGLDVGPDPGPYEAIDAFLAENSAFVPDRAKESFLITWNPKGYLRRAG